MLKRLLALGLILISATMLASCTKYDVVVQTAWGKDNINALKNLTKQFTKKTGLKVNYKEGGWKEIKGNTEKALSAGEYPNIVFAYNDHIASYNKKKANVVNLKNFIDNDAEFKTRYYEQIPSTFRKEGTFFEQSNPNLKDGIFNLPLSKSTDVLYYNKDLFKAFGYTEDSLIREKLSTWEGVAEIAESVINNSLFKSKSLAAVYGYDSDANQFITDYEQKEFAYTIYDENGKGKAVFKHGDDCLESEEVKRLAELRTWFRKKYFITKSTNANKYTSDLFKTEKTLFTIGSSGGVKYNVPSDSHKKTKFNVGVAPIPQHDLKNPKSIQQGPNIAMLDKGDEANEKAWKLMKFLLSDEVQLEISSRTGYSPVVDTVLKSKAYNDFIEKNKKGDVKTEDGLRANLVAQVFEIYKTETAKYYTSPAFAKSTIAREKIETAFSSIIKASELAYTIPDPLPNKPKNRKKLKVKAPTPPADASEEVIKYYIAHVLAEAFDKIEVA